ncbi:MAG: TonB-dependent hemoglobin/transferrin/lactoferrin family receptor [Dichotomicrobium sp.]
MLNYSRALTGASVFAIAATLSSGAAVAQEQDQIAAGPGVTYLDPISVFATLNPIASFDYPGQVSVVEREEIETKQASDLDDILQDVPGVLVDGGARRSGQAPTIRGFRDEDILILLDGARQNFISGHDGRLFIEPDLLKSVEVVKGPISSLYGSGGLGGAIALTTVDASDFLDPGETMGFRSKGGFQSVNDEFLFSQTAFAQSEDGRLGVVGNLSYRESGDIELGNGFALPDDHEIVSGMLKGTAQLTPALSFESAWIFQRDDAVTPGNPQGNNVASSADPERLRDVTGDTLQGTLSYDPADNNWIDGNFQTYWVRNEVEEDTVGSDRVVTRDVETLGFKADNRSRFGIADWGKLTLTYGGEYYRDRLKGTDTDPVGDVGLIPNAEADFYGVFAQAELEVDQPLGAPGELTLIPGVRWDGFENTSDLDDPDYEDTEDQAVSPRIGASYKPVPWLLLFGNYGEAFRAPSYNELYAQGTHFAIPFGPGLGTATNEFLPNPALKPQEGETVEVGAGFDFRDVVQAGDQVKLKGSYWHTDAENFIDLVVEDEGCGPPAVGGFDPSLCYSQNVNTPRAELEGAEIELTYDSARLYGTAAYATIDGKDKDTGEYLGVLYPDKLDLDLGVKVPEWWARFGTRVTFADAFDKVNDPSESRDAYAVVDLYAVFEPLEGSLEGLRLDLGVDNITDEDYEVVASDVSEPGVNYKASIAWTETW